MLPWFSIVPVATLLLFKEFCIDKMIFCEQHCIEKLPDLFKRFAIELNV